MRDLSSNTPVISIVDDDESVREALKGFIQSIGFGAEIFPSAEDFLASNNLGKTSCIIVDVHMPVMTGTRDDISTCAFNTSHTNSAASYRRIFYLRQSHSFIESLKDAGIIGAVLMVAADISALVDIPTRHGS